MLRRGEGKNYQQHPGGFTGVLLFATFGAGMS
jgi:hypothetical protein